MAGRFDADQAECQVFTFKEGLLSAVAHDLELRVTEFEIEVSDDRSEVKARFDAGSIRVVDAIIDGRRSPGTLGRWDKRKIESNIVNEVFSRREPEIRFASESVRAADSGWEIRGTLTIAGRSRSLTIPVHREEDRAVGEVSIHQPDFGIKPYSAMLGTLRIQPEIKVRICLPLDG